MFRRQLRAIFMGIFKPNFLLSWPSVRYIVQLLFRVYFRWPLPHCRDSLLVSRVCSFPHLPCVYVRQAVYTLPSFKNYTVEPSKIYVVLTFSRQNVTKICQINSSLCVRM
jgi:hypothetical protein